MTRKVLITGASSGIGLAICNDLGLRGYDLIGIARDFTSTPDLAATLTMSQVDLSDATVLTDRLSELTSAHPDVNAIICCAGYGQFGHLEQFSPDQIRRLMDVNFTSHACLVRAWLPLMKRAGGGDILFIGSEAAIRGSQRGAIYCASKFAVRGFAQALREECSTAHIRVTIINPGMVRTPFYDELDFEPGEEAENYSRPKDVASMVRSVLEMDRNTVVDEVNMTPLKRVIRFGSRAGDS